MSLVISYEETNSVLTPLSAERVRFGQLALSQSAQIGEPALSSVVIDDAVGDLELIGYRQVFVTETAAASNNQHIWNGWVLARTVTRATSFRTLSARRWTADLGDGNVPLGWRILTSATGASSAKRPAETAGDRIRWLVNSSGVLPSLYPHPTYFANPTTAMDAVDYRSQRYNDVLADIANATGYNFWVDWSEGRQRSELFFIAPDEAGYVASISISNVLADVDSVTCFAPSEDAELRRDPSRVAASVLVAYDGGNVYETRDATGNEFAYVDQAAPVGNVKTVAKATALANRYLADNDEEDDRITCSIIVPAAQVNAVRQGMTIAGRFSHFPGYDTPIVLRVLTRTVAQEEELGTDFYRILMELSPLETVTPPAVYEGSMDVLGDSTPFGIVAPVGSALFRDGGTYSYSITLTRKSGSAAGYAFSWALDVAAGSVSPIVVYNGGSWGVPDGTLSGTFTGTFTVPSSTVTGHTYYLGASQALDPHDGLTVYTWSWRIVAGTSTTVIDQPPPAATDPVPFPVTPNPGTGTAVGGSADLAALSAMTVLPGALPGYTQIHVDDFNVFDPNRYFVYPTTWHDTSGKGTYGGTTNISTASSKLRLRMYTSGGIHHVAAIIPIPVGYPGGNLTNAVWAYRLRADSLATYKGVPLLWSASNNFPTDGEIDFPESNFNATPNAFMHPQGGGAQTVFGPFTGTNWQTSHTYVMALTGGSSIQLYRDGALVGSSTNHVPNGPMHLVLQFETNTSGTAVDSSEDGYVEIDWVAIYKP